MAAADKIRARIAELEGIRERYLAYQQDRVNERDHHGAWDVAINLSETECELSGLRFALVAIQDADSAALASKPPSLADTGGPRCAFAEDFHPVRKGVEGSPFDGVLASGEDTDKLVISFPSLATYLRRLNNHIGFGWVLEKRKPRP